MCERVQFLRNGVQTAVGKGAKIKYCKLGPGRIMMHAPQICRDHASVNICLRALRIS